MNIDPFVQQLSAARIAAGLSRSEVARRSGVSPATLSESERGYHAPSLANLRRWAAGLGFEVSLTKINAGVPVSTSPETGPATGGVIDSSEPFLVGESGCALVPPPLQPKPDTTVEIRLDGDWSGVTGLLRRGSLTIRRGKTVTSRLGPDGPAPDDLQDESPVAGPVTCRRAEWCVLPDDGHSAFECSNARSEERTERAAVEAAERAAGRRVDVDAKLAELKERLAERPCCCPAHGAHPHGGATCLDCPICRPPAESTKDQERTEGRCVMGEAGITHDRFPKQSDQVGRRVVVCFNYDTSHTFGGFIIRDDLEPPGQMLISLDNGWTVRSVECQYTFDRPAGSSTENGEPRG